MRSRWSLAGASTNSVSTSLSALPGHQAWYRRGPLWSPQRVGVVGYEPSIDEIAEKFAHLTGFKVQSSGKERLWQRRAASVENANGGGEPRVSRRRDSGNRMNQPTVNKVTVNIRDQQRPACPEAVLQNLR